MTLSQSEAWHTDTQTWNRNMGYSHDGESELYNIYQLGVHSRICEPCTIIYPDFCWICTKPINRYISFPSTSIIQRSFQFIARMWGSSGVKSMSNNTKVCLPCFIISTDASCLCRNTMVLGLEKRQIVKRIDMTNWIDVNKLVMMTVSKCYRYDETNPISCGDDRVEMSPDELDPYKSVCYDCVWNHEVVFYCGVRSQSSFHRNIPYWITISVRHLHDIYLESLCGSSDIHASWLKDWSQSFRAPVLR